MHRGVRTQNGETVKWYTGYAPMQSDTGTAIGGVWVEISGGRNGFLKGESSNILRNNSESDFQDRYRLLIYSEYYQGNLISSTGERFSLDRSLPSGLTHSGMWINEVIEGKQYDSYYFQDSKGDGKSWIALSLESLGARWHLYTYLRYIIFYLLLIGIALVVYGTVSLARGKKLQFTVRMKLLIAFVVVSLIPVVILAYYNRQYAREQTERNNKSAIKRPNLGCCCGNSTCAGSKYTDSA